MEEVILTVILMVSSGSSAPPVTSSMSVEFPSEKLCLEARDRVKHSYKSAPTMLVKATCGEKKGV